MAYRRWIWCRDTTTGHHMDIDERQLPRLLKAGAVERVENYPVNEGPNVGPRPAKPNVPLPNVAPASSSAHAEQPADTGGKRAARISPEGRQS